MSDFKSEHNLDFEIGTEPFDVWTKFRVGTCHGLYRVKDTFYEILAIANKVPGNGHLRDVWQYFERSCRRDKKGLRIREVWNDGFKNHLIEKQGFKVERTDDLIKSYN